MKNRYCEHIRDTVTLNLYIFPFSLCSKVQYSTSLISQCLSLITYLHLVESFKWVIQWYLKIVMPIALPLGDNSGSFTKRFVNFKTVREFVQKTRFMIFFFLLFFLLTVFNLKIYFRLAGNGRVCLFSSLIWNNVYLVVGKKDSRAILAFDYFTWLKHV